MDEIPVPQSTSQLPVAATQLCPQCHLAMPADFYFCSNCGTKLRVPPLSTTTTSQVLLYLFSAILPFIAYLAITKWEGIKYIRSGDPRTRAIGYIALGILTVSSIVVFWWSIVWIQQTLNSVTSGINDPNSLFQ